MKITQRSITFELNSEEMQDLKNALSIILPITYEAQNFYKCNGADVLYKFKNGHQWQAIIDIVDEILQSL